jgi:hypothetical protein
MFKIAQRETLYKDKHQNLSIPMKKFIVRTVGKKLNISEVDNHRKNCRKTIKSMKNKSTVNNMRRDFSVTYI